MWSGYLGEGALIERVFSINIRRSICINTARASGALRGPRCSGGCWKTGRGRKAEIRITSTKRKSGWNYTRSRTCLLMKLPWSSVIIFKEAAKIKVKGASQWLQVCTALKNTPSVQSTLPTNTIATTHTHTNRCLLPVFLLFEPFLLSFSFFSPFKITEAAL